MLSVGEETLWKDGEELDHTDIFPFLYHEFLKHPDATYVGFALRYDFTMWFKSLPYESAYLLLDKSGIALRKLTAWAKKGNPIPKPVVVGDWEIDILGMKRFKIRPHLSASERKRRKKEKIKADPWMFVNDAFAFWQKSFAVSVDPKAWTNGDAPCTQEEFEKITTGKGKRDQIIVQSGDVSYRAEMQEYNQLENVILGRAMRILNHGFVDEGIILHRDQYYGPGQAAQKKLDNVFDKDSWIRHKNLEELISTEILQAFRDSYYGGRFEAFYYGTLPGYTYEYDIRSAYPDAMRSLPCLCSPDGWTCGSWEDDAVPVASDILLVYGKFRGRDPNCGGLPYRIGPGHWQGRVINPMLTAGWYLSTEIDAAVAAELIDSDEWVVEKWIAFKQTCTHTEPLAFLADMYLNRGKVGKNTPHGIAIKLTLNSMYGKFAQTVGSPKYGNPIYASMITSHCRTAMLKAIATHPVGTDDLVMIATDGIYFRTPHPLLNDMSTVDKLGGWEAGIKENLTVMKPGIYWDDVSRNQPPGQFKLKSRGIPARALHAKIGEIDTAFTAVYEDITAPLPEFAVTIPFGFTSPALALARGKWETCGDVHVNVTMIEKVSYVPKRRNLYADGPYLRTMIPGPVRREVFSKPYEKDFGFDLSFEERRDQEPLTPDGTIGQLYRFALDLAD
jgi:hypothetical protein